jgi:hypothetical protein
MKRDTMETGGRRRSTHARSRGTRPATSRSTQARARTKTRGQTAGAGGGTIRRRKQTLTRRARSAPRGGGSARSTTNLHEIRRWAEARNGEPATVKDTARGGAAGLLRIDFPGFSGAGKLQEISWDEWYQKFRESNLEFLYQDRTASGQQSHFFKLVSRGSSQRPTSRGNSRARGRSSSARSRSRARGQSSRR